MNPVNHSGRQPLADYGKNNNFPIDYIGGKGKDDSIHPEQRGARVDSFVFVNGQSYVSYSSVGNPLPDEDGDTASKKDRAE